MSQTMSSDQMSPVSWRDYLELTKPVVVLLMIVTALVGMILASPGLPDLAPMLWGTLGIAFCAGSAAAVNHLVDQRIDLEMSRTQNRPVAQGRVGVYQAVAFAVFLAFAGMAILLVKVNQLTAWLTLLSSIGYAFIYTMYLKRATPQNIVIGGLAGAAPPLLGWTTIANSIDPLPLLLVLIIFVWTPPHFWALAIHKRDDYAKVNIPMLPVTHGIKYTKLQIFLYSLLLLAVSLLPFAIGALGWLYVLGALLLGAGFIYWAAVLLWTDRQDAAIETFKYSGIYLLALFVFMMLDHYFVAKTVVVTVGS